MPAPKSADRYAQVYWDVIQTVRDNPGETLVLPFESSRLAYNFRARLNFFRKALDYDSRKHTDPVARANRKELFTFANKLRFKVRNLDDGAEVIVVLVDKDVSESEVKVEGMLAKLREQRHQAELRKVKGENLHGLKSSAEDGGESLRELFKK